MVARIIDQSLKGSIRGKYAMINSHSA